MSFKIHLIIVSVIILVVYLVWGITRSQPENTAAPQNESGYSIAITHASWGLNCPAVITNDNVLDKAYVKKPSGSPSHPYKDNALKEVSGLCNGQTQCDIPLASDMFALMAPENCNEKKLVVEYRCFAFDRPWRVEASSNQASLIIDCSDKETK